MNCKGKGSRCEHKSKRLLEAAGYAGMKAGASLGVFDQDPLLYFKRCVCPSVSCRISSARSVDVVM
jgi:hypothetical protein